MGLSFNRHESPQNIKVIIDLSQRFVNKIFSNWMRGEKTYTPWYKGNGGFEGENDLLLFKRSLAKRKNIWYTNK